MISQDKFLIIFLGKVAFSDPACFKGKMPRHCKKIWDPG